MNKYKKIDWIKKENYQNMQKLLEVSDRKRDDACVKKNPFSLRMRHPRQGEQAHSLSGSDQRIDNT